MAARNWYYIKDKIKIGPVSEEALKQMFQSGELDKDTLVWLDTLKEWCAASELEVFKRETATRAVPFDTESWNVNYYSQKGSMKDKNRGQKITFSFKDWRTWVMLLVIFAIFGCFVYYSETSCSKEETTTTKETTKTEQSATTETKGSSYTEKEAYQFCINYGKEGYTLANQIDVMVGIARANGRECDVVEGKATHLGNDIFEVSCVVVDNGNRTLYSWKADLRNKTVEPISEYAKKLYYSKD